MSSSTLSTWATPCSSSDNSWEFCSKVSSWILKHRKTCRGHFGRGLVELRTWDNVGYLCMATNVFKGGSRLVRCDCRSKSTSRAGPRTWMHPARCRVSLLKRLTLQCTARHSAGDEMCPTTCHPLGKPSGCALLNVSWTPAFHKLRLADTVVTILPHGLFVFCCESQALCGPGLDKERQYQVALPKDETMRQERKC